MFSKQHTNRCPSKAKGSRHRLVTQKRTTNAFFITVVLHIHTLTSNCVIKSLFLLTSVARIMSSMRLKTSCLENKDDKAIYKCVCTRPLLPGYRNM